MKYLLNSLFIVPGVLLFGLTLILLNMRRVPWKIVNIVSALSGRLIDLTQRSAPLPNAGPLRRKDYSEAALQKPKQLQRYAVNASHH